MIPGKRKRIYFHDPMVKTLRCVIFDTNVNIVPNRERRKAAATKPKNFRVNWMLTSDDARAWLAGRRQQFFCPSACIIALPLISSEFGGLRPRVLHGQLSDSPSPRCSVSISRVVGADCRCDDATKSAPHFAEPCRKFMNRWNSIDGKKLCPKVINKR